MFNVNGNLLLYLFTILFASTVWLCVRHSRNYMTFAKTVNQKVCGSRIEFLEFVIRR